MGENRESKPAILFKYERLVDIVMAFSGEVFLKLVDDFGMKDKNGNKKRSFDEYMYDSSKYGNTSQLITATRRYNTMLMVEYPLKNDSGNYKGQVYINDYSIDGLIKKMKEFDDHLMDPFFYDKKNELCIKSSNISYIKSNPTSGSTIEFSQDIYETQDGNKEIGVRIGLNDEYYFTVRAFTVWKKFLYHMTRCDLYLWGANLANVYYSNLVGNAVTELGKSGYSGTASYEQYYAPHPDDVKVIEESVSISKSKPLTQYEKKKSFFEEV